MSVQEPDEFDFDETVAQLAEYAEDEAYVNTSEGVFREVDQFISYDTDFEDHIAILEAGPEPGEFMHSLDESMNWDEVIQTLAFASLRQAVRKEVEE